MHWQKNIGLMLLALGLAAPAIGAERAALADAAERRDQAGVRALLQTGVDVNAAQVDGTTALHWAAYNDDAEPPEHEDHEPTYLSPVHVRLLSVNSGQFRSIQVKRIEEVFDFSAAVHE